jgi:ABC-type sugar transport system ATPase subunit
MSSTPHVELRSVGKRFGATLAVRDVDLAIHGGQVHALVGENGAGKSTLGKLIAGVHTPDDGEILLAGRQVHFRSPRQALEHGVTIVAQELSLVPARSVEENVFLNQEPHQGPLVSRRALRQRFDDLTDRSGIEVSPDAVVARLSVAEQQKVEILRALAREAGLIVMDEPTARLTAHQAEAFGHMIRRLADGGTTIVLVSHFLEEVLGVSDTVTVMRDGRVVRTSPAADETQASLIEAMIGRRLDANFPPKRQPDPDAPDVLSVEGLTRRGAFHGVTFSVREGEIVVLTGLVGAGRSEVARAIYGADRVDSGAVRVHGQPLRVRHPIGAIRRGVAMIPEARTSEGLQLTRPVRENITLPYLHGLSTAGVVRRRQEARSAGKAITQTGIKASSQDAAVMTLSGGNQQKVLFARSLFGTPALLIADEPTRGVDVGAKRAIYDLMTDQAANGLAVLVITSEVEEVLGLGHRVIVMRAGSVVAELQGDDITEPNVVAAAFGSIPEFAEIKDTE